MSLLSEMKRRNVLRIGAAYAAVSWLIIQVVETLFPLFGLSDATARAVVIALAIGVFPALVLAWILEWTPQGIVRDADTARFPDSPRRSARLLDRLIIVVLLLAAVFDPLYRNLRDDPRWQEFRESIGMSEERSPRFSSG